jgi:putative methyltransferase
VAGVARRTILISEPHALENPAPFIPYVWAILKSHWERREGKDVYAWLDPIYRNDLPSALLASYRHTAIDVLGLSCYTWNWRLQCGIARDVKARHPNCLVVAGGPEPDYKDPDFFKKYPFIDIVAVKDGEITFQQILTKVAQADRDFTDIGGLYLPGLDGAGPVNTGVAAVPAVFDYSPYVEQSTFYEKLLARFNEGAFHATWETNRGCPYSCSFCDWGSNTMSKLRRFDMSRIEADLDWLGRMRIAMAFSADANFGILVRDLEIADRMNQVRQKYGYPKYLYYSAAKNNPERSVAIARKFAETGICPTHTLAVQHTNEEVLAATDRANISAAKQIEAAKALMSSRIPIDVQLIIGIPGDTPALWRSCLGDLMEWGIHEEYYTFFYHVLPNAPAADPRFMARWEIETVDRVTLSDPRRPIEKAPVDHVRLAKSRLIVKSKTFSRADWVTMAVDATIAKALHNASVIRLIAVYLRLTHQVPYATFYAGLVDEFFSQEAPCDGWHRRLMQHYHTFLQDEDATDHMAVEEFPGLPFLLDPSRWLFVQVCLEFERFFSTLTAYLVARYPAATNLASVIDYQKHLVILPTYNRARGKSFRTNCDWTHYFEQARGRTGNESLGEPTASPGAVVEISDRTCGEHGYFVHPLEWGDGHAQDRYIEWIKHTVVHRNSAAKNNFQQIRLHARRRLSLLRW